MVCMGGNTLTGGRRRRSSKRKTMKGGAFYGFAGALDGGTNGAQWAGVSNDAIDPKTGAVIPDYTMPGGRRRRGKKSRASRKGGRASRKSRKVGRKGRKTMRGGGWNPGVVNSAGVGYGFGGGSTVTSGPPDASAYATRVGGAPMGGDGVRQLPQ